MLRLSKADVESIVQAVREQKKVCSLCNDAHGSQEEREETDPERIKAVRHRNISTISEKEGKYLVHFPIEGVRPLVGTE